MGISSFIKTIGFGFAIDKQVVFTQAVSVRDIKRAAGRFRNLTQTIPVEFVDNIYWRDFLDLVFEGVEIIKNRGMEFPQPFLPQHFQFFSYLTEACTDNILADDSFLFLYRTETGGFCLHDMKKEFSDSLIKKFGNQIYGARNISV